MAKNTNKTSRAKREPKVEIFGEEVGSHKERFDNKNKYDNPLFHDRFHYHHYHNHHGRLAWGLVLVIIGFMFLFSNFGILPPIVWNQILHLWPILIVLIGIDVLIGHSVISEIINSLIGIFIFATILGIIFLHTSPQIIVGLPQNIQNYLHMINNYLQIK